jgi:hypothetical protein
LPPAWSGTCRRTSWLTCFAEAAFDEDHAMRMTRILFFFGLLAGGAYAASSEDAYLAARDKYIAQFKAMEKAKASSEKIDAAQTRALADLEGKLRGIIGEVSVKGFPGTGKINLESLTGSDVGFGMLDGMAYSDGKEDSPQLVVTTRYLLDKWLASAGKEKDKSNRLPADAKAALERDQFYTFSIGSDAAFTRDANLEVIAPNGVELARAVLGGWAQDVGPNSDHWLIVTVIQDGKVYIGSMRPKSKVGEIPACQAIWTQWQQKAEKMREVAAAVRGKKAPEAYDDKTEEKADRDFHACFVQRAPNEPFYPLLVQEAQQFIDRIVGK